MMSRIKTLLVLVVLTTSAQAAPTSLTQSVAQCTGRMSAEMEFEWLMGRSGDEARLFRSHLEDVLEAIVDPAERRAIMSLRIEAKQAHATLLTRSHFNDDALDATRAARMATRFSQQCRGMLIG